MRLGRAVLYLKEEHKGYKQNNVKMKMLERGKRGQVTIFVIIAIVIVAAIIFFFVYKPNIGRVFSNDVNPAQFLQSCIGGDVKDSVDLLASQGGYANPEGFILSNGVKIKYLCYNSEFYKTCVVQQPLLKEHFEKELEELLRPKANDCVNKLKAEYERKGFSVSASQPETKVEIAPHRIKINFLAPMTISKDSTETFKSFEVDLGSEMYDLLLTSTSIIEFESTYGDSETTLYTQYYPNLKIQKEKFGEGSTIYTVSDVTTKESFTFASRSLAWPAGYGLE